MFGIFVKSKLERKKAYFSDVCSFCENFRHNLTYKQSKLKDVLAEFKFVGEDFKKDIQSFLSSPNQRFELCQILSRDEKCDVEKLFSSLGNVDIQTQLTLIDERKSVLDKYCTKYKEKVDKEGKLYVKLGLLFGLCAGVLIV